MRRSCVLFFVLLVAACRRQEPPGVPELSGPARGQPGDTLTFAAVSHDRNGGNVAYMFDWGDGTAPTWGPELAEGDTFRQQHVYPDTGQRAVKVKARDELRQESEWSDRLALVVGYDGPLKPAVPSGPAQAYPDAAVEFTTSAGHVRGESVSVQFDWGDSLSGWGGYVPAGAAVTAAHEYDETGNYAVRARARDREGSMSPWSESAVLELVRRPLEPPQNLRISASSGVFVRLQWNPGGNPDSTEYGVWFRPLGLEEFTEVFTVAGNQAVHDPGGSTGEYTVSARFEEEQVFAADTMSTLPVFSDTVLLGELNTSRMAGYGWDSARGTDRAGSMLDTGSARAIDVYLTDLTPGHLGPSYYLASASFGPDDPGGVVPDGPWRRTGLVGTMGNTQDPLPEYDSLYYQRRMDVSAFVSHVAVYTADGHYALVTAMGPDLSAGSLPVMSWFQRVQGLRLIQHPEPGSGRR
jgi:hypothetical protein